MKHIFFTCMLLLACAIHSEAQHSGRNGAYLEFYSIRHDFSDGFVSINFERNLAKAERPAMLFRVGIYPDGSTFSFPITLTRTTSPLRRHQFEYGLGLVYRFERFMGEVYHDIPAIMFPLMYRYQSSSGFFLRAGANLWVSWPTFPSPSLSLGYSF
jgi:hypothetical protein